MSSSSKVVRRKSENSLLERVKELRRAKESGNDRCFDCGDRGTTFVVLDFGIFTCETCAASHQKYGHKAKNISMTKFSEEEVERMEGFKGNSAAASKWLARFATESDGFRPVPKDLTAIDKFVKNVFVDQKFKKIASGVAKKKPISKKVEEDAVEEKVPSSMLSPPSKSVKPKKASKPVDPSSDSESVETAKPDLKKKTSTRLKADPQSDSEESAKPTLKKKPSVKPKKKKLAKANKSDSEASESEEEEKVKGKKKLTRKTSVEDIVDIGFVGAKKSAAATGSSAKKVSKPKSSKAAASIPDLVDFSESITPTTEAPQMAPPSAFDARPPLSRPVSYTAGAPGYFAGPAYATPSPAGFYGPPGYHHPGMFPSPGMGYPGTGFPPGIARQASYHPGMAPPQQAPPAAFNGAVIPFDFVVRPAAPEPVPMSPAAPEPVPMSPAAPVVPESKPVEPAPVAPMEDPFESLINQRNALEWNPMMAGPSMSAMGEVAAPVASLSSAPLPSATGIGAPASPMGQSAYGMPPLGSPMSYGFPAPQHPAFPADVRASGPSFYGAESSTPKAVGADYISGSAVPMPSSSPKGDPFGGIVSTPFAPSASFSASADAFEGVVSSSSVVGHSEGYVGLTRPLPATEGFQGFDAPMPVSSTESSAMNMFPPSAQESFTPMYPKTKPSPAAFPSVAEPSGRISSRAAAKVVPAFFPPTERVDASGDSRTESDVVEGFSGMTINVEPPKRVHPTPALFAQASTSTPRKDVPKEVGLGFAGFKAASEKDRTERVEVVEGARASPVPAEAVPKSLQDEEYNPFAVDAHYEELRFDD